MQAFKKHSKVSMAIIFFIFANTQIAGRYHFKKNIFEYDDFNQDLEWKIKQSLNTTADPCKDFYAYSCGNFKGYPDSDENVQEITQYLDEKHDTKLMELFEPKHGDGKKKWKLVTYAHDVISSTWNYFRNVVHVWHPDNDETNKQTFREKTRNYYESCVRGNRTNLMKYFEELKIRWPLLPAQHESAQEAFSKEDFCQKLGQLQGYNWNNLIITHDITASKDGSLNIILEPGFNNLPEDIAIEGILKALKIENASVIVQQLKDTQQKWLEIFQNDTTNEYTYTGMTLKNVTLEYPFLKLYLQQLLGGEIYKIDRIWLKNVSFFNYFRDIEWPAEEWQHQLNYLMLHFIFYLFDDSTQEFSKKSCIKDLRNKLDVAVNYIYYEKIFSEEQSNYKDTLGRLHRQIKFVIEELFDENKLNLTSKQKKYLKNKLHWISVNLGNLPYPVSNDQMEIFYEDSWYIQDKLHWIRVNLGNLPYPVSNDKMEIFYKDVPALDNGNYFKNHLLLLKHRFLKSLLYKEDLNFYIASDNSLASSSSMFYVPKQNLVVIPFASLQYPLYHYNFNPEYQLSLMGFLMAHEMGHAFDSNGLTVSNHYSIVEQNSYNKSLECMQNQHPTDDIDERIADLFGERVAYRTYEKFYNLDHSRKCQRQFYLSMAQFFCNKGDLEFIDHDADAVRLHQIVRNSYGFARAFNCPLDSPMNPQKKCRLY